MSVPVSAAVTIGAWSIDSADDPLTELIELETSTQLGVPEAVCRIVLYSPPAGAAGPGLAAAGAAAGGRPAGPAGSSASMSASIRGRPIALGDPITIELTAGDASDTVATAEVDEIRSSYGTVTVLGQGALQRLARRRISAVYENQVLQQIVQDLAGRAGVRAGELGSGATYPYVLVHESRSVLRHVLDLAGREAMDVYQAPDGSLTVKPFEKTGADHVLRYGAEVLDIQVAGVWTGEKVVAYAESPSSAQGTDTWHWLLKDGSPFSAEAGDGQLALAVQDGAVRSKDAAESLAASLLGVMLDSGRSGRVRVLGNPSIKLGDAIEIAESPRSELDGTFKVKSVRHRFGRRAGFVTEVGFSGLDGAAAAGGVGAAAGALRP